MPVQPRAAVVVMVLALHMTLAWVLISATHPVTPPVLDIFPVTVSLLTPASTKTAPAAAPTPPAAATRARATPSTALTVPVSPTVPAPASTSVAAPVSPAAPALTPANAPSGSGSATAKSSAPVGTSDTPASLSSSGCAKPEYPLASRRMEEEGIVALRFRVEANGQVSQSEVQHSSGFKRLDEAARSALSRCRFTPALVQGQATASWATIRYTWRLE